MSTACGYATQDDSPPAVIAASCSVFLLRLHAPGVLAGRRRGTKTQDDATPAVITPSCSVFLFRLHAPGVLAGHDFTCPQWLVRNNTEERSVFTEGNQENEGVRNSRCGRRSVFDEKPFHIWLAGLTELRPVFNVLLDKAFERFHFKIVFGNHFAALCRNTVALRT